MKNKLKLGVMILIIIIIALSVKQNKINRQLEEKKIIQEYIDCLQENFVQRDFCASKQNQDYHILDQLMSKYGFEYEQNGKDLKIKEVK